MAKEWARGFYKSTAWLKTRAIYIQTVDGLCERCVANDKYTPGHIVHHIEWLTPSNINDPYITLGHDNLEYLCQDCHNKEHFSRGNSVRDDVEFDSAGNLVEV